MFNQFRPATYGNTGRIWYELSLQTENAQLALLGLFMVSIAEFEGFYIAKSDPRYPSISQRNNNPGNLRPIGASQGFRFFNTHDEGWEALKKQVLLNINRGLTLDEFFLGKPGVYPGYAPLGDNPADVMENYISHVAARTSMARNLDLRYYFPSFSDIDASSIPLGGMLIAYKPFDGVFHE